MNLWHTTDGVQQNISEKTFIKVDSSHPYAWFDTFYVQIGRFFEAQWDSNEWPMHWNIFLWQIFSKLIKQTLKVGMNVSIKVWGKHWGKVIAIVN